MGTSTAPNRVMAYVDGFNLYYGMRDRGWGQFYWNDPCLLIKTLVRPEFQLVGVKYFTARVHQPEDKRNRQTAYLDALRACSDAQVIYGQFLEKHRRCKNPECGFKWLDHEEKMTDTAIGVNLVADAFLDAMDVALLVGGDTDIVPAVRMVRRHFPRIRLEAWFPPRRKNQAVADVCDDEGQIDGAHLERAVMPDEVDVGDGITVRRPSSWVSFPPKLRRRGGPDAGGAAVS